MKSVFWTFLLFSTSPIIECVVKKLSFYSGKVRRQQLNEHSYIVALVDNYKQYLLRVCIGTLITGEYVLTAGHCISDKLEFVQFGEMHLSPSLARQKTKVINTTIHPSYVPAKKYLGENDIGLAHVHSIHLRLYGQIAPLRYKIKPGHSATIAGYGKHAYENTTSEGGNSKPLVIGRGSIMECSYDIRNVITLEIVNNYMCVNPELYYTHYLMNSGSPLLCDTNKVIGVATQVYFTNGISIYTAVAPYWSWIIRISGGKTKMKVQH